MLVALISEACMFVCMGISEVDGKFLYAVKLVPPKDFESILHPDTTHWTYYYS